jgi:hypothetical protein
MRTVISSVASIDSSAPTMKRPGAAVSGSLQAVERERHVGGGQRIAVVEGDAFADREVPREVVDLRPAGGEAGLHLERFGLHDEVS